MMNELALKCLVLFFYPFFNHLLDFWCNQTETFQQDDGPSSPAPDMDASWNVPQPLDNCFLCCSILRCMEVPLRQDVSESVQLLCQLSYPQLQLLVFLLELLGPLLGQHDPPPSLVPALSHGDVVPLSPQSILCAVLVDEPLVCRRLQRWKKEHGEVLEVESTRKSACG